jgi:hypothetical protein
MYYGRNLTGLLSQEITIPEIKRMILYPKKKKQVAEAVKKQRGTLGKDEIMVINRIAATSDADPDLYNTNVVPELNKLMVPYEDYEYRDPEYIDPNFVTSQDIKGLLRNKFQKNSLVKKTDVDINAIAITTQNLINNVGNPHLSLQTLVNTQAND